MVAFSSTQLLHFFFKRDSNLCVFYKNSSVANQEIALLKKIYKAYL